MAQYFTHHGLKFTIESQGFRNHDADKERAESNLVDLVKRLGIPSTFAIWAALRHTGQISDLDGRAHPVGDRIHSMEHRAAKSATRGWSNSSECYLTLGVADPD